MLSEGEPGSTSRGENNGIMGFVKSMLALSLGLSAMGVMPAPACTRVMYKGLDSIVLTARSMDWKENIGTDLWIFPRG